VTYTNEQIEFLAKGCDDAGDPQVAIYLRAWLAERQQRAVVTPTDLARKVGDEYFRLCKLADRKPMAAGFWMEQLCAALQSAPSAAVSVPDDPDGFSAAMVLDEANNWTSRATGKQMLLNYAAFLAAAAPAQGEGK